MSYQENVELDARCVCAAMQGGVTAMLAVALRSGCPSPDEAMKRAELLKIQPQQYLDRVCKMVDEIISSIKIVGEVRSPFVPSDRPE